MAPLAFVNGDSGLPPNMIFHIEILNVSDPVVNRVLSVPRFITFDKFHRALQIAFCWDMDDFNKPYYFKVIDFASRFPWEHEAARNLVASSERAILLLRPEDPRPYQHMAYYNSHQVPIWTLFHVATGGRARGGRVPVVTYEYDGWTHFVNFVGFAHRTSQAIFCLSGQGAPLAKGCGGPQAWEDLKRIYRTPDIDLTLEERDRKDWYEFECKNGLDIGVDPWSWGLTWVNQTLRGLPIPD